MAEYMSAALSRLGPPVLEENTMHAQKVSIWSFVVVGRNFLTQERNYLKTSARTFVTC